MISLKQEQNFNYRTITKVHLFHLCDQDIFNIFYAVCKGRQHDPVITPRDSNKRAESSTSKCPLQFVMIFTPLTTDPFLEQSTMRTTEQTEHSDTITDADPAKLLHTCPQYNNLIQSTKSGNLKDLNLDINNHLREATEKQCS